MLNARRAGWADAYHWLLRSSWTSVLLSFTVAFLVLNAAFAVSYGLVGGVTHAARAADYFFFSVQTFATIGYGAMYPLSDGANLLVTAESAVSLFFNAVVTGLAFAKFARPTARVIWSKGAVVSDRDGVPTLMFRVANERINHVVEATLRLALIRTDITQEGERVRRIIDMSLVRNSSPSFLLTWTAMHQIKPGSPLYGQSVEALTASMTELIVTLTGLDETLGQTIHARTSYLPTEIRFGARFDDILGPVGADGRAIIDYSKFDATLPAKLSHDKLGLSTPAM